MIIYWPVDIAFADGAMKLVR